MGSFDPGNYELVFTQTVIQWGDHLVSVRDLLLLPVEYSDECDFNFPHHSPLISAHLDEVPVLFQHTLVGLGLVRVRKSDSYVTPAAVVARWIVLKRRHLVGDYISCLDPD